jgi:hypothetical protein
LSDFSMTLIIRAKKALREETYLSKRRRQMKLRMKPSFKLKRFRSQSKRKRRPPKSSLSLPPKRKLLFFLSKPTLSSFIFKKHTMLRKRVSMLELTTLLVKYKS